MSSITYKAIDRESGIKWCVRAVMPGGLYGLNHCLTYDENKTDPLIEFYDMDSMAAKQMRQSDNKTESYLAEEYGQFVSRYYLSTLLKDRNIDAVNLDNGGKMIGECPGINLDGGVDRWEVSGQFVNEALSELINAINEQEMAS